MLKKYIIMLCFFNFFTLQTNAQDINRGIKLIKNEKYNEAKKYLLSLTEGEKGSEAYFHIGEIYFIKGDYDSAKIYYNKGIGADIENPLNYAGLSNINIIKNELAELEKNQAAAIELGDERTPEVYIILSQGYRKIKKYDTAIELANKALGSNAKYLPALIALGNIFLEKNDGTEAIKNFEKAIDMDNANPEALTNKAKVYLLVNNYSQATSLLEEAIRNDPEYSAAYHELAELHYALKNYSESSRFFSKYLELSEETAEKKKRFASILYLNKDYPGATSISNEVLQAEPGNVYSIRIAAYSYAKMDNKEMGLKFFKLLFEIPSVEYQTTDYENYADLLINTGNDSLAIEYLIKIIEKDTTRKDIQGKLSVIYFRNKKWKEVTNVLEKKYTLTAQEYFDLGKAYYFLQEYPKADSTLKILGEKLPELATASLWQARVKTNLDPESEEGLAKPYYEKFIDLSKEDTTKYKKELIEAYSYLGYYYYIKQDKIKSKENWLKLKNIDPDNKQAAVALANM